MDCDDATLATQLLSAAEAGDTATVDRLLTAGVPAYTQEDTHGASCLMLAARGGHGDVVELLLAAGAPWNAIDRQGRCAGNYALDAGFQTIVDRLVDAGVQAELLLGAASRIAQQNAAAAATAAASGESLEYLSRGVRYDGDRLLDEADDAVMMEWETPLMEAHADRLCATGGDVLNVGFGMGIIDGLIAARAPRSHTIMEAHPDVLRRIERDGWHARPGVRVLAGRWQESVHRLIAEGVQFDGIFYDTYGEHDTDMAEFHAMLPALLRPGGLYSFFNGASSCQPCPDPDPDSGPHPHPRLSPSWTLPPSLTLILNATRTPADLAPQACAHSTSSSRASRAPSSSLSCARSASPLPLSPLTSPRQTRSGRASAAVTSRPTRTTCRTACSMAVSAQSQAPPLPQMVTASLHSRPLTTARR